VVYNLERSPTFFSLLHIRPFELEQILAHFEQALAKDPIDLKDFEFPGLAESAYHVLYEQGKRGDLSWRWSGCCRPRQNV